MIIKSLKLQNVRSYKECTIDFPMGISLFEGDIGSGKSTILMALEFALFGLGSSRGASLLRAGESKGAVGLIFDVDGDEHTIFRTLERTGRGIQQGEGYIKGPEGVINLSSSELKEKVLQILNFNEPPDPKSQSWIYRYAIFTPQEEMKAVLFMRPDLRLQTLRKALRIEEYKTARDNALSLANFINRKAERLRAKSSDLEIKMEELKGKVEQISKDREALDPLLQQEKKLEHVLKVLDDQLSGLRKDREDLSKVEGEIPELRRQISRTYEDIDEVRRIIETASEKLEKIRPKVDELLKLSKPSEKDRDVIEKEIEGLRKKHKTVEKAVNTLDNKIEDYEHIHNKGVCPTCDRKADPKEFTKNIRAKSGEREEAQKEADRCEQAIEEADTLLEELRIYNQSQVTLSSFKEQTSGFIETIEQGEEKMRGLQGEKQRLEERVAKALEEFEKLKELSAKLKPLEGERKRVESETKEVGKKVSSLEATIVSNETANESLTNEIENKEGMLKRAGLLDEYRIWLEDYFAPTLDNIERHVMISFQQEFNESFQKLFGLLVEDPTKEARIDEEFTPIMEQDGYEQEVNYLSGGEKNSVALAYRLALNTLVRKVSTSMKSNLLILDEPTDGFSKEQLGKVRDILSELECPQIIIVSHEKELESFADQIFRVTKSQGESKIGARV